MFGCAVCVFTILRASLGKVFDLGIITVVFNHHGNAREFLDGNRPSRYMLPRYTATVVLHGTNFAVICDIAVHDTAVFDHDGIARIFVLRYSAPRYWYNLLKESKKPTRDR